MIDDDLYYLINFHKGKIYILEINILTTRFSTYYQIRYTFRSDV